MREIVVLGVAAVLLSGCGSAPATSAAPAPLTASAEASPSMPPPSEVPAPIAAESKAQLASLTQAYTKAKRSYQKALRNADLQKRYVIATVRLGTASMTSPTLDRRVKYRQALRYYREALKLDPQNREALSNKNLIESIYRQLGRPIPQ